MKNCSGINCPMQYGSVDPATCPAAECCPNATPPLTNYDRIISKSPEELAEFLIQDGDCPPKRMYPDSCPNCDRVTPKVCYDCWLDWLKQEATE